MEKMTDKGDWVLVPRSDLLEEDSYVVHGSAFYRCKLCGNESGAGLLNKGIEHSEDCPLAAPQPPAEAQAQGGGDVVACQMSWRPKGMHEKVWTCRHCKTEVTRDGSSGHPFVRCTAPPSSPPDSIKVVSDIEDVLDRAEVAHKDRNGRWLSLVERVNWLIAAPPSAPVGVESEPGAVRALVTAANAVLALHPHDDQLWTLESAVRPFNATRPAECSDGCPPQQVCDYCQIAALAQQPAAVDGACGDACAHIAIERDMLKARAEQLAEALREAFGQVRELCDAHVHPYPEASFARYEAALHPTAAQEDSRE